MNTIKQAGKHREEILSCYNTTFNTISNLIYWLIINSNQCFQENIYKAKQSVKTILRLKKTGQTKRADKSALLLFQNL